MATIKNYTDKLQSRKLAEILPLESADMYYCYGPCWSLAALLKYLSEIKPQVYIPLLFPSEGKWMLQFVEYGHGNVCEVSCNNHVDCCVQMIIRLNELNLL